MRTILVALSLLAAARTARADQCQVLDADQTTAAVALLTNATILAYCEPCGDAPPAVAPAAQVHKVTAHLGASKNELSISVDGKDVDLAYTFVKTGKRTFTNVALMVGCPATGVSGFVAVGGKPAALPTDERIAKLVAEQRALDARVAKAVDAVVNAQNDSDRSAAKARLTALQREQSELQTRIAEAKAAAARAAREKGKTVRKECLDNPLAKGC